MYYEDDDDSGGNVHSKRLQIKATTQPPSYLRATIIQNAARRYINLADFSVGIFFVVVIP